MSAYITGNSVISRCGYPARAVVVSAKFLCLSVADMMQVTVARIMEGSMWRSGLMN